MREMQQLLHERMSRYRCELKQLHRVSVGQQHTRDRIAAMRSELHKLKGECAPKPVKIKT
jgi:hypothetical protein